MKVFISADIEGVAGVVHWNETYMDKPDYKESRKQMTAEVRAACEGALDAGASEIWVRDAHGPGRNIIAEKLPQEAKLVRGWSGHPFAMVQELDDTFQAVMMIGYHSRAGSNANPLSHTMSGYVSGVSINGRYASEFMLHAYAAAYVKTPVVFVSGDEGLCEEVGAVNPAIETCAVKKGVGDSVVSIHPDAAVRQIREGTEKSLKEDLAECIVRLPDKFSIAVHYSNHAKAFKASFYPGASLRDACMVSFESNDYFEIMRFFLFTL